MHVVCGVLQGAKMASKQGVIIALFQRIQKKVQYDLLLRRAVKAIAEDSE